MIAVFINLFLIVIWKAEMDNTSQLYNNAYKKDLNNIV